MLTAIKIENFKGVEDSGWLSLAPVTLLYGRNASGKSTLFHALLFLRQTLAASPFGTQPRFKGAHIDLDGFQNAVFRHDLENELCVAVRLSGMGEIRGEVELALTYAWDEDTEAVVCSQVTIQTTRTRPDRTPADEVVISEAAGPDPGASPDADDAQEPIAAEIVLNWSGLFDTSPDEPEEDPQAVYTVHGWTTTERTIAGVPFPLPRDGLEPIVMLLPTSGPTGVRVAFRNADGGPSSDLRPISSLGPGTSPFLEGEVAAERDLGGGPDAACLGAIRSVGEWIHGAIEYVRQRLSEICHVGPHREMLLLEGERHGAHLDEDWERDVYERLLLSRSFREKVNSWLSNHLGLGFELTKVHAGSDEIGWEQALALRDCRHDATVKVHAVGYGVGQVLPVIALIVHLAGTERGTEDWSLVLIEQPELHLHPAAQCDLADVFVSLAGIPVDGDDVHVPAYGSARCNLFIESHSEHIVLRIARRLRENWAAMRARGDARGSDGSRYRSSDTMEQHAVVLYCDIDAQNQRAVRYDEIRFRRDGMFAREWPRGFFDERLEEELA